MKKFGFTLIELLVVISIISLLASIVFTSINSARSKARDTRRRLDLNQLRTALELYYDSNGSYPFISGQGWRANCASSAVGVSGSHPTSGADGWIPNLAPAYIPVLPVDPLSSTDFCYFYVSSGQEYKIITHYTVETGCPLFSGDAMRDPIRPGLGSIGAGTGKCTYAIYTPNGFGW